MSNVALRVVSREPQLLAAEPGRCYHIAKRALDIVGALMGLALLALLLLPFALLIKREDGGPVWYRREAIGLDRQRFYVLKLRTMRPDADTYFALHPELQREFLIHFKLRDDPRVTRIGRFLRTSSLDELPQMLNVLRGEMSLVGPRYVRPEELARYGLFAVERVRMRPGITGLWQTRGRNDIPYTMRVIYDRTYYYTRSVSGDIGILLATIPAVLRRRGAY
ncbi:MAG TPA: sugar transferase [Ktedonobacterales bacterium]|jgi:undecaprenyl-phosphate galactose phosphotransferase|nr:sugar transferase [Ktedonobacterales bacterium]